jgi:glycosyltransferase involved in cell wall biosynthesis
MFSVVIPSYRHARYLAEAVMSALASRDVAEILVLDDGSTDGSAEVLTRLARSHPTRIRELSGARENLGTARRLEQLVAASRSEWIAVLNSDDAFAPGRFDLLRARTAPGIQFVCGHLSIIGASGERCGGKLGVLDPEYPYPAALNAVALARRGEVLPLLANQNFVATTSNMVFTRRLHAQIGGFRNHRYVHDWDFALRAALHGGFQYLPHYLTLYRAHGANTISEDARLVDQEVREIFRDLLADVPALRADAAFGVGLRGNRYLDRDWLDDNGIGPGGKTTACA